MDITPNVAKLEMRGAGRRPGRLVRAQLCTVRSAGGVRVGTHSAHSSLHWADRAGTRAVHVEASRTPSGQCMYKIL